MYSLNIEMLVVALCAIAAGALLKEPADNHI